MTIIAKFIISIIILGMFTICVFLGWRVLELMKRVKQLQAGKIELLEERAKQSNKLRLKGIEVDEINKWNFILSALERKMILNALNMPQYKGAIEHPQTNYEVRKAYKQLKEKVKASFGG